MADSELAKALKDLPIKVQTSSLKSRKEVFENVIEVLPNAGINDAVVRGICKVIHITLLRYRDSTSQFYVKKLLKELLELHSESTIKHFSEVLNEIGQYFKNLVPSQNTAKTAYQGLSWSCILFTDGWKHNEKCTRENISQIIEAQASLLWSIFAFKNEKIKTRAIYMVQQSWSTVQGSDKIYLENLKKLEQTPYCLALGAVLAKQYTLLDKKPEFQPYLEFLVETFVKNFISSKVIPLNEVIDSCAPIFEYLTSDLFKKLILPAIQKAMLRNPEVILNSTPLVIRLCGLNLDLSPFAIDIGNSLIANLHSKDDDARTDSAEACKILAQNIKEPLAIEELLKKMFAVFNGSDGKLTIAEHKIGVLQGAGNLSHAKISQEKLPQLVEKALEYFIKVLEIEVHEKTLCHCLEMLSLWTVKINGDVPKKLLDIFKNGINLKTSTILVKTSYIQCIMATFTTKNSPQAKELYPILVKSVEKAIAQPQNHQIVTEGLTAVCLLLKLTNGQIDKETSLNSVTQCVFDMDKQIFVSEKYLSGTTEDGLFLVMQLCEKLLTEYSVKVGSKNKPLLKAILFCTIEAPSKVRRRCATILRNMISDKKCGVEISRQLLNELHLFLETPKKTKSEKDSKENEKSDSLPNHAIVEFITSLCSKTDLPSEDAQLISLDALLPCHHPVVANLSPNLWKKITTHLGLKPKDLVAQRSAFFIKFLIEDYLSNETYENALSSIVSLKPDIILPNLIQNVLTELEEPSIRQISKDDYFTFLTPEGELYDKSVVPGDDSSLEMNLKRESKAYSYKDQLEELQLRREIEEKKRREGKLKKPEYTPKQLEAIKNQKNKEQAIRTRLSQLNAIVIKNVSLIKAAARGDPLHLSLYFKTLLPVLIKNLQSPLAAPIISKIFIDLRKVVFPSELDQLSQLISYVTLRLLKPSCDIDSNWEKEDLNEAMSRTISLIQQRTVSKRKLEPDESGEIIQHNVAPLTVPAFAYTFVLIKNSLLSKHAHNNEEMVLNGLQIISEHSKLRGKETNGVKDVFHPEFLPVQQMFELLVQIIYSSSSGRVQSQAEACLLDVANSVSGHVGCSKATTNDIDVLLEALQSRVSVVRDGALRALTICVTSLPTLETDYDYAIKLNKRIWIAKFDVTPENRILADELWSKSNMSFPTDMTNALLPDVEHYVEAVQLATAQALAALLQDDTKHLKETVKSLLGLYSERLKMIPAKLDEFGREVEKAIDTWQPRRGVALALAQLAPLVTPEIIGDLVRFFVSTSLSDRHEVVRKEMLNAALKIVDLHGKETVGTLWPVFDDFMGKTSKSAHNDAVKQAVVILMGSLARHLDKDDERIKPIVLRLIQALSTPSQTVQEAVANCLPPLIPAVKEEAPGYVNKLLHQLLKGDKYGERKGAAYGLAGLVKGMGILALKQHDIMTKLSDAIQDKKNYKFREGALFAFEMLFQMLGKLFEPYIVHVLPHLLQCFGDTSSHVRTAADDTAKVIMSKLSGHGVKLILPSLLDALNQDSWRTKTGSVELLGAMAYCAPKQLSSCLPSIVPKLIEVLSDSHMKVQEAGAAALKVIGSVIRNPEIQAIVPVLLKALQDPSNKTSVCLQTLLDTQFVHFIDAPSLALIMPVVQRAFLDRSTETRKMSAQIIGNMYSLTDQKDLEPYLSTVMPGLKTSLLDPVPEVRSVSARALGAMVRGMGESSFEDLLPWLMQTLTSESSSVDRSGAAQGLSEVVGGLGVEKLHKLMPEIIATAERTDIAPHVKDGYIMMFIYMPAVFTSEFTPYIGQIITPILKALADETEYVRDTALRAGQRIVSLYADSAILLLLPELERGLFDDNWRIRYSSVQLLGDLLYRISGVTGKMSTETASEDDNFGTEQSHLAIINSLGAERRNRVLAGLYMGRSDVALMVRQAALHVWKVVVTNTPRTLREILPTLFSLLLGCLASDSYDKRQVAARTLGDLVRKLGERVLPEIIPILERGLQSDRSDQRQGVCIGLSEIMASTSRDMVLTFVNSLVPTVKKALCDPLPEVRQAAAKTFDSLHSTVGVRALDDILPALLVQLTSDDAEVVESTLDGLRQVMAIKSRVVLPYLVPQLIAPPPNTRALSILASVAGEALNKYLPRILPALQSALATSRGTPDESQQMEYCQAVLLAVTDEAGIRIVVDTLLEATRNENADHRRAAATLLCGFCANSKAQYIAHVPQLLRGLIHLCTDNDMDVLQMSWEALNAITKTLEPKQLPTYVSDVRQAVRYAMSDMKGAPLLPGFCLPKGVAPILPIFREALLNGDSDEKESAAQGLGEIIKVTSDKALQPSVVAITGPLIRILGDRFGAPVKISVLETLGNLLAKVGVMLKQFLPQLQTTFIKALNDPHRTVRLKSATALSYLIVIHLRVDPLFTELHNTILKTDDVSIRETTLQALRGIISPAGDKMSEPIRKQIHATLIGYLSESEDTLRNCSAGCLGALCKFLSPEQLQSTLNEHLLADSSSTDSSLRQGRSSALQVLLKESPETIWTPQYKDKVISVLLTRLTGDNVNITQSAIRSCGYLMQYLLKNDLPIPANLLTPFVRTMNNSSNEVKQLLARVCIFLAKTVPTDKMATDFLKLVIPTLVNGTKEKNMYVKANSEIALIAIMRLKDGDSMQQRCLGLLDVGAKEALTDVITKVLKKIVNQSEGKDEDLDDTMLT